MRNTLFSDYYLERLFPEDAWYARAGEKVAETTAGIAPLFDRIQEWAPDAVEAELEDRLVRPVLRFLGYPYLVQTPLRQAGQRTPDYLLFDSEDQRRLAEADRPAAPTHANALAEAKRWDLALDRGSGDGYGFDSVNPSFQIDTYLRDTDLSWGILTNGRLWRLCHRTTSYRLDSCFEIDLNAAIEDAEEMRRFIAFFAREAMSGAAMESFLNRALQDSVEYAQALGASLEANVYEALRLLSEGLYLDSQRRGTNVSLEEVRHGAFIVIFRLLFVLYAEARRFLPISDPTYDLSHSLRRLAHEVADLGSRVGDLSATSLHYWTRLRSLFEVIRDGSPTDPVVDPYDGGLFEADRAPLLDELGIDDRHIAEAIRRLTRAEVPGQGQGFVSYQDLGVRELGTIYEGLLEQHIFVADTEMVTIRRGAKEYYAPADTPGRVIRRFPAGSILLRTDTGERRDTGSYYTPESVVRYMTTSAITKALERRRAEHDPVDAVLGLRILDPAMGSGHFLVDAVDVLARELVAALSDQVDHDESEVRWARREVVESCIYGVDSNPLAVELAKLSLWLVTMQSGKPLSFLDHHLRHGNSLYFLPLDIALDRRGQRRQVVEQEGFWAEDDEAIDPTASPHLIAAMRTIAGRPTDHLEDVMEKRALFEQARERYRAVREFLDLSVAARFAPELAPQVDLAYLILYQGGAWDLAAAQASHEAARQLSAERHFFHWESEFPEVLATDDPGFDVVLSNPPYVNAWRHYRIDPIGRQVVHDLPQFTRVARGHWDLFVPFVALGVFATRSGGLLAYVLPNPAHREGYASSLREFLMEACEFVEVVDYGTAALFKDVSRQSVTWVLRKRPAPIAAADELVEVAVLDPDSVRLTPDEPAVIAQVPQAAWRESDSFQIRVDVTAEEAALSAHLRQEGVALRSILTIKYGAQVSGDDFGRERYLGFAPGEMQNPKRFIEGRDLRPYALNWPGRYLDYQADQFYGPREESLFESPKVVVRHLSGDGHTLIALADGEGFYTDHGCILGNVTDPEAPVWPTLLAIAAVLNSRIGAFYYQANFATDSLQGEFSHVYPAAVKNSLLPGIPNATELCHLEEVFTGGAWAGAFLDPGTRVERWSQAAAVISARLHDISSNLLRDASELAGFVAHATHRPLASTWSELFAAGNFSRESVISAAEAAVGAGLAPDQWSRIGQAAATAIDRRDSLVAEAQDLENALDDLFADAFRMTEEQKRFLANRLDPDALRRSRLWAK